MHERALSGLLKGGGDIAFESAMGRAKEVGISEDKVAMAQVASFLFQGDTASAAALLPKWDAAAANDPWYQMLAGATLERAGDARARDRYAAAVKLDPDLVVSHVALARSTAIDGDAQKAMELAKAFRARLPDRAEGAALVALAWGRDPNRSEQAPPEADEVVRRAGELPIGLAFVPHAVSAIRAIEKKAWDEAKSEVQKGLAACDGPGAATWLGSIAIATADEALARKAALAAVAFSAVYAPARVLAARVALLGDRLDEALKATEDLDANSPDVAIVRAAASYERADPDGVGRALEAVPVELRKLPFLASLSLTPDALAGRASMAPDKLLAMAGDEAPWSDLVAMDLALDEGELETADKIASTWKNADDKPLRALRLARLARYQNKLDVAEPLTQVALERGTVTPRVLSERVFLLAARGKSAEVGPLLARYPLVLGPMATWLSAYATAVGGNSDAAKGKAASLDPPPATAPFPARMLAAVSLAAMKDRKRGEPYLAELLATGSQHPDLVAAALSLGFKKVDHKGRKPTYER
jgi:hypothetical protein